MKKTLLILSVFFTEFATGQNTAKKIIAKNGEAISFLEYKPTILIPGLRPVIIYLHGLGERGSGDTNTLRSLENNEIPKLIKNGTFKEDFIVLAPQLNSKFGWWQTWYVSEMIDFAITNGGDPSRVYLTGLSLGGGGVWAALEDSATASRIAAAAPVCGTCNYGGGKWIVKNKIPVWIFHAADDPTVGIGCSGAAYSDLKKKGVDVTSTFYQTGGHGIWPRAYSQAAPVTWAVNDPDVWPQQVSKTYSLSIYDWFKQYVKYSGVVTPPVSKTIVARLFVSGFEVIVYSDRTTEIK